MEPVAKFNTPLLLYVTTRARANAANTPPLASPSSRNIRCWLMSMVRLPGPRTCSAADLEKVGGVDHLRRRGLGVGVQRGLEHLRRAEGGCDGDLLSIALEGDAAAERQRRLPHRPEGGHDRLRRDLARQPAHRLREAHDRLVTVGSHAPFFG